MHCVEENEGREGVGDRKHGGIRQSSLPYVYVRLHKWCDSTLCTIIEMKSCIPFVCNELKCSL